MISDKQSVTTADVLQSVLFKHNNLRRGRHCLIVQSMTFWSNFWQSSTRHALRWLMPRTTRECVFNTPATPVRCTHDSLHDSRLLGGYNTLCRYEIRCLSRDSKAISSLACAGMKGHALRCWKVKYPPQIWLTTGSRCRVNRTLRCSVYFCTHIHNNYLRRSL